MRNDRRQFVSASKDGKKPRTDTCSKKCCKPWDSDGYNPKAEYDAMRSLFAHCWACSATRKPQGYFGPWLIERAHIANKPRREDRRLVVMLCTLCHKANHGERVAGFLRPRLSAGQLLDLKLACDSEWYDHAFINKHSVRILEREQLCGFYVSERMKNRGGHFAIPEGDFGS